jgi:FO synthase subunit 2
MLKEIDPVVSDILNQSLDSKDISIKQTIELFNAKGTETMMIAMVADLLRKKSVGNKVTYVINRNINFTNVCIKRCGFCAYSRDFRNEESYFLPISEVVRRAKEAWKLGATEVCIQAGLPPKMDGFLYVDICKAIKKELPNIHIHAFSPEEILYGCHRSGLSIREYLSLLKEAGLGSLPGTAAEILDQDLRDLISPGRISVTDWINVIKSAHALKIPTTSTIMYGHVETAENKAKHLELIRSIQKQTNGFTEFVPLSFVHKEAPMYNNNLVRGISPGPTGNEVVKMHAISRIMLNNYINNIQVSWVKEGVKMSQVLLGAGVNDFGGTLINESISTSAGSEFGQVMKPMEIRSIITSAGRVPAQRNSVYGIIKVFDGEAKEVASMLDTADTSQFGSYHELIKLDKFRYSHTR